MKAIFFQLIVFLSAAASLVGLELHVSPQGSDSNPGNAGAPFATVVRARNEIRALKSSGGLPAGGVTVWLHGGHYPQADSLVFDAADSGTADRPIVYASAPEEKAHLIGAKKLESAWFSRVDGASPIWSRVDAAARGQLYAVDLGARGIADYGSLKPRGFVLSASAPLELFFQGQPMALGRWPNRGAALALTAGAPSSTQIVYSGSRPERWSQARDVWMHGLWSETWADYHVSVGNIDTGSRTIDFAIAPAQFGTKSDRPFYAYNLLEEIDEPGEYYLDRTTGILYFWPPAPLEGAAILVSMLEQPLVRFDGAHHVRLKNLVIEASRGPLVKVDSGSNVRIEYCTLRNAGQFAVQLAGSQNGLDHCEVSDCGEEGVRLLGGDRASLTPGGNYVNHSQIRRTGATSWTYKPGINFEGGCGNSAAHNLLEDMPHSAILFSGNNHVMEYNEITRVCRNTSDAGAIYSGHDWGYRGNVIRFNFLHHIETTLEGYGAHGVYLDDCVSGVEVSSNIFYRISNTAIFCGGGRDNIMRGNLVALSGTAHHNDDRGRFRMNNNPGDYWNLLERLGLEGIRRRDQPWAGAYPACAAIPESWDQIQQGLWRNPENSVFSRNAGWGNGRWTNEQNSSGTGVFSVYAEMSDNDASSPALFDEAASLDRARRATTLVASVAGFTPVPFAAIGPSSSAGPTVTQPPLAPVLGGTAESSSKINLQWSDVTGNPASRPAGFALEQRNDDAAAWQAVQTLAADIKTAAVVNLSGGEEYSFRLRAFNAVGSTYSNVELVPTPAVPLPQVTVASGMIQVEAESPVVVVSDVGGNSTVGVSDGNLDSGESVRLYDTGDAVRIVFTLPNAGTYRIGVRVRSGGTTGPTSLWPNGYRFRLDGNSLTAVGDPASISALDPAYGGCYWGTMVSASVTLTAGDHSVEVAAGLDWSVVDCVQITPVAAQQTPLPPAVSLGDPVLSPVVTVTVTVPVEISLEATSAAGAMAIFAASAQDSTGRVLSTIANPASGSVFRVGTSIVTVVATDAAGGTTIKTFAVTVRDTIPPVLTLPGAVTVSATGPSGAAVAFTVTAFDSVSGAVTPQTLPGSGTMFPVGTTFVSVTAVDGAGNTARGSFPVTVLPPAPVAQTELAVWTSADVGAVNFRGSTSVDENQFFTISGSGTDIWNDAVGFQYAHQSLVGDGVIAGRVWSVENADGWAKAGLMIRETLEPGAPFAALYLTPGNGAAFQWRPTEWAACSSVQTPAAGPVWLRLERSGNSFIASTSRDGSGWQELGRTTVVMPAKIYVGMAVTSHNSGMVTTAIFDSISARSGVLESPVLSAGGELIAGEPLRFEVESPLVVVRDLMINGTVGVSDGELDSDRSVKLYDAGDAVQVNFPVLAAGTYRIGVRVRAGGTTSPTAFWPEGYRFKLDGNALALAPDYTTLSAFDPSYGGCYWGVMTSDAVNLSQGAHALEIEAAASWAVADYVEIAPLSQSVVGMPTVRRRESPRAARAIFTAPWRWTVANIRHGEKI